MGKIENDKLRRIRNEHFIRAFEHVARCLSMTQGELAEAIGTKTAYISNFRKGIRPVTEDAIDGLIRISGTQSGLQVFSEYLYGNSDIMLLDNVSDEEMIAARKRHNNPDYDKIEKQKAASPSPAEPPANIPDMSYKDRCALCVPAASSCCGRVGKIQLSAAAHCQCRLQPRAEGSGAGLWHRAPAPFPHGAAHLRHVRIATGCED